MVLTIFQPTFITLVLTLPSIISSSCYGTEANGRTAARIYFFINIDSHNIVLQKKETVRKANLRAQVGSNFQSPDCHLVSTVKPNSHPKGDSEEFLPCAKAEPVQHCSLRFPQCQGDTEVFLRRSTNASSIYRQVPLTLPPKVSGAPAGTRTQNPRLKRAVLLPLSYRRKYQISLLPTPAAADRDLTQHPTPQLI